MPLLVASAWMSSWIRAIDHTRVRCLVLCAPKDSLPKNYSTRRLLGSESLEPRPLLTSEHSFDRLVQAFARRDSPSRIRPPTVSVSWTCLKHVYPSLMRHAGCHATSIRRAPAAASWHRRSVGRGDPARRWLSAVPIPARLERLRVLLQRAITNAWPPLHRRQRVGDSWHRTASRDTSSRARSYRLGRCTADWRGVAPERAENDGS